LELQQVVNRSAHLAEHQLLGVLVETLAVVVVEAMLFPLV